MVVAFAVVIVTMVLGIGLAWASLVAGTSESSASMIWKQITDSPGVIALVLGEVILLLALGVLVVLRFTASRRRTDQDEDTSI